MNRAVSCFLARHNFVNHADVLSVAQAISFDMAEGLSGGKSDQDMIRTFCNPPENPSAGKSVIVIDAGGTNFRSCLVTFDAQGKPGISFLEKTRMPGVEKELTREEFFSQIAANISRLKDKADRIGFCFSYPMRIQENGDGVLLGFSKEVKVPEAIGCEIGKCLKEVLLRDGWKSIEKITLCNDTVAALLAGAACAEPGTEYSSYIGMILGTGLNAAYIQPDSEEFGIKRQIVVCESGKFRGMNRSGFDLDVDSKTVSPGTFVLEKLCSGAYLGPLSLSALRSAASDGLFSEKLADGIRGINALTLIDADGFLHEPYNKSNVLGRLAAESASDEDYDRMYQILDAVAERSARYAAAILVACAVQTGGGRNASRPVCILCNGTTFFKTWMIRNRVLGYLDEILTGQMGIYWRMVSCDNDITLGAAIAGLIE